METTQYWIQEQAPDGGYFDSVGMSPSTTEEQAKAQCKAWQEFFSNRKVRLVVKTTKVIDLGA